MKASLQKVSSCCYPQCPREGSELHQLESLVTSGRVDGIVLSRIEQDDPRVARLQARGFPFVAHGRNGTDDTSYCWLDTDGRAAFADAFELLYGLGHRRFGLLSIDDPLTFRILREDGMRNAFDGKGDPGLSLCHVSCARYDPEGRPRTISTLLDGPDRPTAVLAVADGLAIELMAAAQARGLSIPEDLSVIGFDNIPAAAHVTPGLTTFDARIADCASELAAMLLARIAAPDQPHVSRLLTPQLVLRHSHGPAPRA
ncbi:MAG: hypothetical protein EA407_04105 [Rhodobacteraceae bacterium]|nr:MAG: hypothetical protein EA407_04105 [Paracoccaceae bacterium]